MAADSRATIRTGATPLPGGDDHRKLFKVGRSCALGLSGDKGTGVSLYREIEPALSKVDGDVFTIARLLGEECRRVYALWYGPRFVYESILFKDAAPAITWVLGGYSEGQPQLYLLRSTRNFVHEYSEDVALAGIPIYAQYVKSRLYDRKRMGLEAGRFLATFLILESAEVVSAIGGEVTMIELTPEGGYNPVTREELDRIKKEVVKHGAVFRRGFHEGRAAT